MQQQQQVRESEFAEEMKSLREIVQAEYENKIRNAFGEIEELKNNLEENAKERQAKNERMMARQLEDKDGEINELSTLMAKLQLRVKEQRAEIGQAGQEMQN